MRAIGYPFIRCASVASQQVHSIGLATSNPHPKVDLDLAGLPLSGGGKSIGGIEITVNAD